MKRLAIWALVHIQTIALEVARVACVVHCYLDPKAGDPHADPAPPASLGDEQLDDEFEVVATNGTLRTPPPDAELGETELEIQRTIAREQAKLGGPSLPKLDGVLEGSYEQRFGRSRITRW